jgi:ABC-type uncharacterized transport system substrate-binding protein
LLAATAPALAHPHVWVTVETTVVWGKDETVSALRHKWTFDELYSSFAVQGLDKKGGNAPTRDDLQDLAKENIEALKEFDYFTHPKAGGDKAAVSTPTEYYLEHKDGLLSLHFTLPFAGTVAPPKAPLAFSVYDPTYFIAFQFAKEKPITQTDNAPKSCEARLSQPGGEAPAADKLTESFVQSLGPGSNLGASMADSVVVSCQGR